MLRDEAGLRIKVHQGVSLGQVDQDDDRLTALREPDEQLLADMKHQRAIRRPFHRSGQRAGNRLDCFPSCRIGWPCPFHVLDPAGKLGNHCLRVGGRAVGIMSVGLLLHSKRI